MKTKPNAPTLRRDIAHARKRLADNPNAFGGCIAGWKGEITRKTKALHKLEGTTPEAPTVVIFRKWAHAPHSVIACMPELPSDVLGHQVTTYEHVGQHGGGDMQAIIGQTRRATPEEYAPLKRKLEAPPFGYVFTVRERESAAMREVRRKTARQTRIDLIPTAPTAADVERHIRLATEAIGFPPATGRTSCAASNS